MGVVKKGLAKSGDILTRIYGTRETSVDPTVESAVGEPVNYST
jgi:hypothetical protein